MGKSAGSLGGMFLWWLYVDRKEAVGCHASFADDSGGFFLGSPGRLSIFDVGWNHVSRPGYLLLIYLGVIPTAFAYFLYSYGLARTTAIRASIAALLEPLTATVLATTLLGEWLSPSAWVGATLLLATLVLLTLPEKE